MKFYKITKPQLQFERLYHDYLVVLHKEYPKILPNHADYLILEEDTSHLDCKMCPRPSHRLFELEPNSHFQALTAPQSVAYFFYDFTTAYNGGTQIRQPRYILAELGRTQTWRGCRINAQPIQHIISDAIGFKNILTFGLEFVQRLSLLGNFQNIPHSSSRNRDRIRDPLLQPKISRLLDSYKIICE